MSDIGICKYCKHIDKDIIERPCLHCAANLGAFEFDLSEHDAKVRAEALDEFENWLYKRILLRTIPIEYEEIVKVLEQMKEQKHNG